jgi:hypothetical protein
MANEKERMGTSTRKHVHARCYQHHTEMLLKPLSKPGEVLLYACHEPGCLVRYDSSKGYFLETEDASTVALEIRPDVRCVNDGRPMYLAEVKPQRTSFRLWKCPECNYSRTNDEEISGGLGKKMGA